MARKPNYDFEKRRKEQERAKKKEEKLRRRQENAANGTPEVDPATEQADGADETPPAGTP